MKQYTDSPNYDGNGNAPEVFDVAIVGGGLVGASLATALANSGLSLLVIEPVAVAAAEATSERGHPSFDERTVALTYNARQIYTGIGVWQQIAEQHAQPIKEIHISERGRFGMTHLRHTDVGVEALGYVVPAAVIGEVLYQRIQQSSTISLCCPGTVSKLEPRAQYNVLSLSTDKQDLTLKARLVVVADGSRSRIGEQIGIHSTRTEYPHNAILSLVETDRVHHDRAYERFTAEGPLALLPHSDKRYAVVWTTTQRQTATRMALSDAEFIAELQTVFGMRAGKFARPTARRCYPLQHSIADCPVGKRTVLIGNAAHIVHPVAGQGFNLGLRDVALLAELLHHAAQHQQDPANPKLLAQYDALRRRETAMVRSFTDGLIRLFGSSRKSVGLLRNVALVAIELFPPSKRLLLKHTMGLASQPSRLGVGLPLG